MESISRSAESILVTETFNGVEEVRFEVEFETDPDGCDWERGGSGLWDCDCCDFASVGETGDVIDVAGAVVEDGGTAVDVVIGGVVVDISG